MSPKRALNLVFGFVLVGGISFCSHNFASAEGRVRELCSEIRPGMSGTELREFAVQHGLGPRPPEAGVAYIVESKTFGRFGCKVLLEGGVVKAAEYSFAS
jgi:hypothetical protein